MGRKSSPFVLIDEHRTLKDADLKAFVEEAKMAEGGFHLISIIGPQSSGKSTLLNKLFGTNYVEMDAKIRRGATTLGIWLAKSSDADNCTLVMDVEGSDGNKRGEDDTNFEKQAAVFAFAVSDIVMINMWSHSIGLVHAAGMPLLRTVFEARRRLKIQDSKTTLWFVVRDNTSPIDVIKNSLREDISQAWNSVAKGTPLSNSFEVDELRKKLLAELTTNGKTMHPSSAFSSSVQRLWPMIKKDKDLNLTAVRVLHANERCAQIADEILSSFKKKDFRKRPNSILKKCLSEYDKLTEYYDEGAKNKQREELRRKMQALIDSRGETEFCRYILGTVRVRVRTSDGHRHL